MNKETIKNGIDTELKIIDVFDFSDIEKMETITIILENLKDWWGVCINDKKEYNQFSKLTKIITDIEQLKEDFKNNK